MGKRIGLITLQDEYMNFGAALQIYALYSKVIELGYDCEIIDLKRPYHSEYKYTENGLPLITIKKRITLNRIVNRIRLELKNGFLKKANIDIHKLTEEKILKFKQFNKRLKYSQNYYSNIDEIKNSPPVFDIYLTGSDQVWNPKIRFTVEPYFLTFAPEKSIKVAYAPSFGISELPDNVISKYRKWIADYKHLSVREETGQKIIEQLTDKKASVVLDPTFLLSQKEWSAIAKKPFAKKPYLFLYCLGNDLGDILKIGRRISNLLNLEMIMTNDYINEIKYNDITVINDLGPEEFIGYIEEAAFVITNSFHGTVFSIKFKKLFISFALTNVSSRITNLLDKFNLSSRLWSSNSKIGSREYLNLDYTSVSAKIDKEIDSSINFLQNSLS